MIKRLRPEYTEEEFKKIYPETNDHTKWWEHELRIKLTIDFGQSLIKFPDNVADLSAGKHATIAKAFSSQLILGDYCEGYPIKGKLEDTIHTIPNVYLYICSETLEHVNDPKYVLESIRKKSKCLILSTPLAEWGSNNPEHYWAWDMEGIQELMDQTGWRSIGKMAVYLPSYDFQIWVCV